MKYSIYFLSPKCFIDYLEKVIIRIIHVLSQLYIVAVILRPKETRKNT